jgi:hypothetical protein
LRGRCELRLAFKVFHSPEEPEDVQGIYRLLVLLFSELRADAQFILVFLKAVVSFASEAQLWANPHSQLHPPYWILTRSATNIRRLTFNGTKQDYESNYTVSKTQRQLTS